MATTRATTATKKPSDRQAKTPSKATQEALEQKQLEELQEALDTLEAGFAKKGMRLDLDSEEGVWSFTKDDEVVFTFPELEDLPVNKLIAIQELVQNLHDSAEQDESESALSIMSIGTKIFEWYCDDDSLLDEFVSMKDIMYIALNYVNTEYKVSEKK